MAAVGAFVSLYVDLLLRPHAGFQDSRYLITYGWSDGTNAGGLPLEIIEQISEESATIEVAAGTLPNQFPVGPDREETIGEMVTSNFFDGVRPRRARARLRACGARCRRRARGRHLAAVLALPVRRPD
jgi:hypothetical protein